MPIHMPIHTPIHMPTHMSTHMPICMSIDNDDTSNDVNAEPVIPFVLGGEGGWGGYRQGDRACRGAAGCRAYDDEDSDGSTANPQCMEMYI